MLTYGFSALLLGATLALATSATAAENDADRRWQLTICYNTICNITYASGFEFTAEECAIQAQRFRRDTPNEIRCQSTLGGVRRFETFAEHTGKQL